MAKIPSKYLPPKKFLPETVHLLPELRYPEKFNMTDMLLDQNVRDRADKVAIYYGDDKISYRNLQAMVNRFANALRGTRR